MRAAEPFERVAGFAFAALALLLLAPTRPPRPLLALTASPALSAVVGIALFAVLAGRSRRRFSPSPLLLGAGLIVGASEEAIWRGFVLARAAPHLGLAAAVVLSTCGFALSHYPAQRRRGVVVHLLTGAVFATLFAVSGSLAAAVAAHAAYDVLALSACGALPAAAAVRVRNVTKRFGRFEALHEVDATIEEGAVVALLGPNGAGKTTLVAILLGLRRPDGGDVEVFGERPGSVRARRLVAAAPQDMGFPPTLRVQEVVDFVLAHRSPRLHSDEVLEHFGLAEIARRQVGGISGGQRRRLAVAVAFAPEPRLAILDEPTANLDVESRRQVWEKIRGYASRGRTVLLTTHHLDEAEALADRIIVLHAGRLLAEGAPRTLKGPGDTSLEDAYLRLTGAAT